jgi:hypothetical protein
MIDSTHLLEAQVAHTSTRINQQIAIDQKRRGSAVFGDRPGTAQHTDFHSWSLCMMVSAVSLVLGKLTGATP